MSNKHWRIIAIGICIVWAVTSLLVSRTPPIETVHTTDTVFVTKYDTLELTTPIFVEKKVIDTLYVYTVDSTKISLPIEQKRYTEPDKYDLYISGVEPRLDTIRVFNKTEYKTITNNITNTVYRKSWRGYIGGQISTFDNQLIPSVNLMLTTPKSFAFGAGVGIYDNKPVYQLNVSYKIFER